jgi:hypothetical protein
LIQASAPPPLELRPGCAKPLAQATPWLLPWGQSIWRCACKHMLETCSVGGAVSWAPCTPPHRGPSRPAGATEQTRCRRAAPRLDKRNRPHTPLQAPNTTGRHAFPGVVLGVNEGPAPSFYRLARFRFSLLRETCLITQNRQNEPETEALLRTIFRKQRTETLLPLSSTRTFAFAPTTALAPPSTVFAPTAFSTTLAPLVAPTFSTRIPAGPRRPPRPAKAEHWVRRAPKQPDQGTGTGAGRSPAEPRRGEISVRKARRRPGGRTCKGSPAAPRRAHFWYPDRCPRGSRRQPDGPTDGGSEGTLERDFPI